MVVYIILSDFIDFSLSTSMIGYLKGTVLTNNGKTIILSVANVGYSIIVPPNVAGICSPGSEVELFTHLHVREDELTLYGFQEEEQLAFFKLVTTVSGIGPKMGIEILSLPIHRVKQAIVENDTAYLTTIKGMGAKLASRLVLELKNKVTIDFSIPSEGKTKINSDVVIALENLGYDRKNIMRVLNDIEEEITDEEELIKYCLKHL